MSGGELKEAAAAYRVDAPQDDLAPLIDELYRKEVLDARRMPLEEKLILGERLFRWACEVTLAGIRSQNPDADEAACQVILRERIDLGKRMGTL